MRGRSGGGSRMAGVDRGVDRRCGDGGASRTARPSLRAATAPAGAVSSGGVAPAGATGSTAPSAGGASGVGSGGGAASTGGSGAATRRRRRPGSGAGSGAAAAGAGGAGMTAVTDDGRAAPTRVSVARTAPAVGRLAGSLVSSRAMIGTRGPGRSWPRGSPCTTAEAVARAVPARNGGSPSTVKYSSAPSAHRSVAGVMSLPVACSGAMYDGEPTMRPVMVTRDSSRMVATPKSVSLARSPSSTRTLAGFTSRWTTPARWAASSAVSTWRPRRAARSCDSGPASATSSARLGPSTSSMTSQMAPDSSTTS